LYFNRLLVLLLIYWGVITPLYFFTYEKLCNYDLNKPKTVITSKTNSMRIVSHTTLPTPTVKPTNKPIARSTPIVTPKIDIIKPQTRLTSIIKQTYNGRYKISAYDLSVQSCGKSKTSRSYGITASGYSLKNQSRASAMTIAADLRRFKMGTKVYLKFCNSRVQKYNGIYTVRILSDNKQLIKRIIKNQ
jgi:3D (Asp-Asp-Asp) domain-containing protein